jgi:hypothetical protein
MQLTEERIHPMRWLSRERAMPEDHNPRRVGRWLLPAVAAVVVVAVGASLLFPAGRHQWALSIFRQPTRYTALYFTNASTLPAMYTNDQKIHVQFGVRNDEGRAVDYEYKLTSSDGIYSDTLRQSEQVVAAGATWKVALWVKPRCLLTPCHLQVALPGHPETIDLLITLNS